MSDRSEDPVHSSSVPTDPPGAGSDSSLYRRLVTSRLPCLRCAVDSVVAALSTFFGIETGSAPPANSVDTSVVTDARSPSSDRSRTPASDRTLSTDGSGGRPRRAATPHDADDDHPLLGVDPELLNSERRILQLLIIEGGKLPQSELAERTRWSESTISRTLCRMEAQGRIERHRLGSGKCVVLPQDDE